METIDNFLGTVVGYVWSLPLVGLLIGAGIVFTVLLGVPQIKGFIHALRVVRGKYDDPDDPGRDFSLSSTDHGPLGHGGFGKHRRSGHRH